MKSDLQQKLIVGEYQRLYDDRYRVALPLEIVEPLGGEQAEYILAKERKGCLSLWNASVWNQRVQTSVDVIVSKLRANMMNQQLGQVQRFSRLLSTRSRPVKLGGRGRLLIPEGFREFLELEPNNQVMIVGAGVCLEIWNIAIWNNYVSEDIGEFEPLLKELLGT